MAETKKLEFPELAAALRSRKVGDFLKFFGPGAIIASVTIGSGETVWASRSGAIFGYAMFWAFSLFLHHKSRSSVFRSAIYDINRRAPHGTLGATARTKGIISSSCRRSHGRELPILFIQLTHYARHDLVVDII